MLQQQSDPVVVTLAAQPDRQRHVDDVRRIFSSGRYKRHELVFVGDTYCVAREPFHAKLMRYPLTHDTHGNLQLGADAAEVEMRFVDRRQPDADAPPHPRDPTAAHAAAAGDRATQLAAHMATLRAQVDDLKAYYRKEGLLPLEPPPPSPFNAATGVAYELVQRKVAETPGASARCVADRRAALAAVEREHRLQLDPLERDSIAMTFSASDLDVLVAGEAMAGKHDLDSDAGRTAAFCAALKNDSNLRWQFATPSERAAVKRAGGFERYDGLVECAQAEGVSLRTEHGFRLASHRLYQQRPGLRPTLAKARDLDEAFLAVELEHAPHDIAQDPGRLALWRNERVQSVRPDLVRRFYGTDPDTKAKQVELAAAKQQEDDEISELIELGQDRAKARGEELGVALQATMRRRPHLRACYDRAFRRQ